MFVLKYKLNKVYIHFFLNFEDLSYLLPYILFDLCSLHEPRLLASTYKCSLTTELINYIFMFRSTCSIIGSVFQSYSSQPSLTPDDDVFKHLSLTYANNHAKMSRGVACKSATPAFDQGDTTHPIHSHSTK